MMSGKTGPHLPHYHNTIKSTNDSAVYKPISSIIFDPLTDNYTIGENIGRGKFAVVKKCTNKAGEVFAAKFIKKRRRGKSCREEILREVVMLEMALDHPRLVDLKEVYETQSELILITEYCAGGELFTECILEEKFNESDVKLLMSQILEGLVYLHEKNIVHLDLKPQNILLTDEFPKGSVKICDLGFACLVNTGEDIRDIIGTPDYVAPEVLNYDPLGLYTDMWSIGVLTYVMLTTCSPFAAEDKQMTFSNITTVNLDFPDDLFSDISMSAQDFIQKLLKADPSERMTAKECFNHEWLADLVRSGTNSHSRTVIEKEITCRKNDSEERIRDSKEEITDNEVRNHFRNKIENQASEMSVTEEKDDEGIFVNSESDAHLQRDTKISIELSESPFQVKNTTHKQNSNAVSEEPINDEITNISTANNETSSDVTPDTDSSMCLSDRKLQEVDSGMLTSSEPLDISGRTSVELGPDTELNSETIDDIEMLNRSCIGSDIKDEMGSVSEGTTNDNFYKGSLSFLENRSRENIQDSGDDAEMDVEMFDPCDSNEPLQVNETKYINNHTKDSELSKKGGSCISVSSEIITCKQGTSTIGQTLFQPTSLSNSDIKAHTSIDDSINSISSGESLKRGMCSETESYRANDLQVDSEEYEFVSVSKRVRSYEDNMTLKKSPSYSPKISRSPRIGRHSRHQHQHH